MMAIDRIGWTLRPNPTRKESGRGRQREQERRKEPQNKRNDDPNERPGRIDELA